MRMRETLRVAGLLLIGLGSMSMGWIPEQTPADPTEQNQVVSDLADQSMTHLGFQPEDAVRYHDRILGKLNWARSRGFFPTAFHIGGAASAVALVGIGYDMGITVAPLPDRRLVMILTRKRLIEGGPEVSVGIRAGVSVLFNSDPLQSQDGDSLEVTADLDTGIDVEASMAVGITRADRELKNDLIACLVVGDTPGARADMRRIFHSPHPFEIGLAVGIDAGAGIGITGGIGHETELARAQGRIEDLPMLLDSLLRQALDRGPTKGSEPPRPL